MDLILAITCFILSRKDLKCQSKSSNTIVLDINSCLLGYGLLLIVAIIFNLIRMFNYPISIILLAIFGLLFTIILICWTIISGIIIFRDNINCLREKDRKTIFTLIIWCLLIYSFIMNTCFIFIIDEQIDL